MDFSKIATGHDSKKWRKKQKLTKSLVRPGCVKITPELSGSKLEGFRLPKRRESDPEDSQSDAEDCYGDKKEQDGKKKAARQAQGRHKGGKREGKEVPGSRHRGMREACQKAF